MNARMLFDAIRALEDAGTFQKTEKAMHAMKVFFGRMVELDNELQELKKQIKAMQGGEK